MTKKKTKINLDENLQFVGLRLPPDLIKELKKEGKISQVIRKILLTYVMKSK